MWVYVMMHLSTHSYCTFCLMIKCYNESGACVCVCVWHLSNFVGLFAGKQQFSRKKTLPFVMCMRRFNSIKVKYYSHEWKKQIFCSNVFPVRGHTPFSSVVLTWWWGSSHLIASSGKNTDSPYHSCLRSLCWIFVWTVTAKATSWGVFIIIIHCCTWA